jgi:AcrR family transcriptional regulator
MSDTTRKSTNRAKGRASSAERIVAAAKVEFARHGLSATRIDEIARTAEVSQQLIYHYFQNKENLYAEALISLADESAEFVRDVNFETMDPRDAIDFIARGVFSQNISYGARMIADQIVQGGAQISSRNHIATYHHRLEHIIESVLARGRASGLFAPAVGSRELLMAMISLSMGHSAALDLLSSGLRPTGPDPREWTDFGVDFIKRAITNRSID